MGAAQYYSSGWLKLNPTMFSSPLDQVQLLIRLELDPFSHFPILQYGFMLELSSLPQSAFSYLPTTSTIANVRMHVGTLFSLPLSLSLPIQMPHD